MAQTKAQQTALLNRRMLVMEDYLKGATQVQLASKYRLNQSTISDDLAWVRRQWVATTLLNMDEAKARELARIDRLEVSYWEEWERSRKPKTKQRKFKMARQKPGKMSAADGGDDEDSVERTAEEWEEVEEQLGDKKYLDGVQWCVEQRCKLLGLNAPTRTEVTGANGGAIRTETTRSIRELSNDDLDRLLADATASREEQTTASGG